MNSIDPLNTSLYFTAAAQERKKEISAKKAAEIKRPFLDILHDATDTEVDTQNGIPPEYANLPVEKAVEKMLDSVYMTGDLLKKNPSKETIEQYRKAVKNFLGFVEKTNYKVIKKQQSGLHVKKRHEFTTIKIIDDKLDNLAMGLLYNQKNQLDLLAKVDEINGILIDLIT